MSKKQQQQRQTPVAEAVVSAPAADVVAQPTTEAPSPAVETAALVPVVEAPVPAPVVEEMKQEAPPAPLGTLKVLIPFYDVIDENERRVRAGGSIFKPVFLVAEQPAEGRATAFIAGFATDLTNVRARYAVQKNPHADWLPRPLDSARIWFETNDDVEFIPFNETQRNG